LEEAVLEERGEKPERQTECAADLTVTASIPDRYVPSPEQRMDLYRRIAAIRSEEEADDLTDELIDRYGDPPKGVNNLISVALMRAAAARCGISEIAQKGMNLNFMLSSFELERVSRLCAQENYRSRLLFSAGEKPYLSLRLKKGEDALKLGRKLVEDYAKTGA
jgi:transcription-repair coupling factor (superfamily II helicase)